MRKSRKQIIVGVLATIEMLVCLAIVAIVASPDYQTVTERVGSVPVSSTPAELRQVMDQTLLEVSQTVQEFGLQQDQ